MLAFSPGWISDCVGAGFSGVSLRWVFAGSAELSENVFQPPKPVGDDVEELVVCTAGLDFSGSHTPDGKYVGLDAAQRRLEAPGWISGRCSLDYHPSDQHLAKTTVCPARSDHFGCTGDESDVSEVGGLGLFCQREANGIVSIGYSGRVM